MEGFSYSDIFATKGIEYLIIIAFLLLLIPFWIALNKQAGIKEGIKKSLRSLSPGILQIPQGLFYSKNHTWMFLEKSGAAKIGLDDLLLHITGEVKLSNHKKTGELVQKGELLTEIVQDGKILKISSPLSGRITEINTGINNSDTLHDDPYEKGWIFKVKPSKWIVEADACYFAEEANNWLRNEVERFKDFLAVSIKNSSTEPSLVIMQDGGVLSDAALSAFPNEIWQDFEREFLSLY